MLRLLLTKVASLVGTLLLVAVGVLALAGLLPGDPARIVAGDYASPEIVSQIRKQMSLDKPFWQRYVDFIRASLRGDLGTSVQIKPGQSVSSLIAAAAPVTFQLVLLTMIFTIALSLPAGYLAASRPNALRDRLVTTVAAALLSIPTFVLSLVLISFFALTHSWLPALGYVPISDGMWVWFQHLALPALALGAVSAAELTRQVRGALIDTLEQDYVRTAEAKGMPPYIVIWKHAFKNAASPILTVAGLQVARIVGGAVIVEQIFALPGLGSLAIQAVLKRDLPVMQGVVIVVALLVVLLNDLIDLCLAYLNPKVGINA